MSEMYYPYERENDVVYQFVEPGEFPYKWYVTTCITCGVPVTVREGCWEVCSDEHIPDEPLEE